MNLINLLTCTSTLGISLLFSKIDRLQRKEAKIVSILGWITTIYFIKRGVL